MVILNKENFEEEVKKYDGIIMIDFWSDKCEPCKELIPEIEELIKVYSSEIKFCKLDITKARRLAIKEKVLGVPTIAIYTNGNKIDEITKDDVTKNNIEKMIKKYI